MFARQTNLKQHIEIVADPAAEEVKWLAACTLLDGKPVQLHKPSVMKRSSVLSAAVISALLSTLNSIFAFFAFCMLSGTIFCQWTHLDFNWFMHQTNFGQTVGVWSLLGGGAGFWAHAALRRHQTLLAFVQVILLAAVACLSLATPGVAFSIAALVMLVGFYTFGGVLSKLFVKELPQSFQLDRSIISFGVGSSVFGAIAAYAIYCASTASGKTSQYVQPEAMTTIILAGMLAFTTMAPTVVCASSTKCSERGSVAFLNLFFHAPLLTAMVLCTGLCSVLAAAAQWAPDAVNGLLQFFHCSGLSPALHDFGVPIALCMTLMTVVTAALAAAGSALGTEIARSAAKSRAGL